MADGENFHDLTTHPVSDQIGGNDRQLSTAPWDHAAPIRLRA